jgi:hypothetical protein
MGMQVIALTSANEAAMQAVATQLLETASAGQLQLSVLVGINSAQEAQAVFQGKGELWRVGLDSSKPELDELVDRTISATRGRMAVDTARELRRFMDARVAA